MWKREAAPTIGAGAWGQRQVNKARRRTAGMIESFEGKIQFYTKFRQSQL